MATYPNARLTNTKVSSDQRFSSVTSGQYKSSPTRGAITGATGNAASAGTATFSGVGSVDIFTPAATPNSMVFTSFNVLTSPATATLEATVINNGQIRITSSSGVTQATVNWWVLQPQ